MVFLSSRLYIPRCRILLHPHQRNIASKINTNMPAPPIKIIVKIMSRPSIKYVPLVEVEGIAPSSSRFQQRVLNNNSIYYNIVKIISQAACITFPLSIRTQLVPLYTTVVAPPVSFVHQAMAPISEAVTDNNNNCATSYRGNDTVEP